jgi:Glutathione S-transferase, N-terminal domain
MKLYYLPGSCALGPHIALEYSGLTYEAVRVERGRQTDPAYLAINPLGRVPTLVTAPQDHGASCLGTALACGAFLRRRRMREFGRACGSGAIGQ